MLDGRHGADGAEEANMTTNTTKAAQVIETVDAWIAAKRRVDAAFAKVDAQTARGPFARASKAAMLEMDRAVRALSRATDRYTRTVRV